MAITGNGKSGFDSGEGALETATTAKAGSRRANCPIPTPYGEAATSSSNSVVRSS